MFDDIDMEHFGRRMKISTETEEKYRQEQIIKCIWCVSFEMFRFCFFFILFHLNVIKFLGVKKALGTLVIHYDVLSEGEVVKKNNELKNVLFGGGFFLRCAILRLNTQTQYFGFSSSFRNKQNKTANKKKLKLFSY